MSTKNYTTFATDVVMTGDKPVVSSRSSSGTDPEPPTGITCVGATNKVQIFPDIQYWVDDISGDAQRTPTLENTVRWRVELDGVIVSPLIGYLGENDIPNEELPNNELWTYLEQFLMDNVSTLGITGSYEPPPIESPVQGHLLIRHESGNNKRVRLIPDRPYNNYMDITSNPTVSVDSAGVISFCLSAVNIVISCDGAEQDVVMAMVAKDTTLSLGTFTMDVNGVIYDLTSGSSNLPPFLRIDNIPQNMWGSLPPAPNGYSYQAVMALFNLDESEPKRIKLTWINGTLDGADPYAMGLVLLNNPTASPFVDGRISTVCLAPANGNIGISCTDATQSTGCIGLVGNWDLEVDGVIINTNVDANGIKEALNNIVDFEVVNCSTAQCHVFNSGELDYLKNKSTGVTTRYKPSFPIGDNMISINGDMINTATDANGRLMLEDNPYVQLSYIGNDVNTPGFFRKSNPLVTERLVMQICSSEPVPSNLTPFWDIEDGGPIGSYTSRRDPSGHETAIFVFNTPQEGPTPISCVGATTNLLLNVQFFFEVVGDRSSMFMVLDATTDDWIADAQAYMFYPGTSFATFLNNNMNPAYAGKVRFEDISPLVEGDKTILFPLRIVALSSDLRLKVTHETPANFGVDKTKTILEVMDDAQNTPTYVWQIQDAVNGKYELGACITG